MLKWKVDFRDITYQTYPNWVHKSILNGSIILNKENKYYLYIPYLDKYVFENHTIVYSNKQLTIQET